MAHPEIRTQIREYVFEECANGNQSKSKIYDQLTSNGIKVKIGIISVAVDEYIDSLYN